MPRKNSMSCVPLISNWPPLSSTTSSENTTLPLALMVMSPSTYTRSPKLTFIALLTVRPSTSDSALTLSLKPEATPSKSPKLERAAVSSSPTS